MRVSDLVVDFLEYCEIEKGHSQMTVQNYDLYLRRFLEFAGDITPAKITQDSISKFRLQLNRMKDKQDRTLGKKTQNYHLIALRSFLKYLARRNIKSLAPEKIELASIEERQVSFLEPGELTKLFEATNTEKNDLIRLRDRAILETLFSTGLRVSELVSLNQKNVNLDQGEFSITGKGGKSRVVFLSEAATARLKEYLNKRRDNSPALFIRHRAQKKADEDISQEFEEFSHLTPRTIQRIIQKYTTRAGIGKKVTPHVLRHSFATDLLRSGADLRSVQSMLGHTSVTTTQVYTHVTDKHLKEAHEKYHGKSEKKLEARNSKSETNSNYQNNNDKNKKSIKKEVADDAKASD